ncbi:plasmid mobilization protein [Paraburkholderia graminis]|uniref:plasmid mobilization protein n=1 Tax=Paraburkholderia graminis TaxID=60548 RepID=UPI00279433EF|nr:hypothetical protein [Paraburkholderia graminis]MDQ0622935.1 hypothetical protein [Paraburkholderia graminis]
MTKPSERIVVFVTPAQKRAIAATADELGISVSELMRRAVLSFDATSEQVKAASIVDRLNAPRAPDALDAALRRVAQDTEHARAALPLGLRTRASSEASGLANADANHALPDAANRAAHEPMTSSGKALAGSAPHASQPAPSEPAPLLPADVLAALTADVDEDAVATAEAVARVAAARAAADQKPAPAAVTTQTQVQTHIKSVLKRPRLDIARDDDDPQGDLGPEGGRFA